MIYDPIRTCIYCGATTLWPNGGKLAEEHIIPLALDGQLTLPEASCRRCGDLTGRFEAQALRGALRAARIFFNFGRQKATPERFPLFVPEQSKETKVELPVADYPTFLLLPNYTTPGLLVGKKAGDDLGPQQMWILSIGVPAETYSRFPQGFATPALDTFSFFRMLAKIGHAYLVAELGLGGFKPLLLDIIQGRDEHFRHLIGGTEQDAPTLERTTAISLTSERTNDRTLHIVDVQFFAHIGAPVYRVVAGSAALP